MNYRWEIIVCLAFGLAWNGVLRADSATNFDLPIITANGVMTMDGTPQVLFKVAGANKEISGEQSYVLNEGDEQNGIKVVAIDELSGTVTFDNHGTVQKIVLEKAVPSNNYVPPPAPVSAAAAPISIPTAPEQNNGGMTVVVMGNHAAGFKHINGVTPQNAGANNFNFGRSQLPGNTVAANQPAQTAPSPSLTPATQTSPNGPQEMSVGADMERFKGSGAPPAQAK